MVVICIATIVVGGLIGLEQKTVWMALGSLGVLAVMMFLLAHPEATIPLFLLTYPIRGFSLFRLGPANLRLSDLVLVIITMTTLGKWLIKRKKIRISILSKVLTAWVLMNGLSIMWSSQFDFALTRFLALLRGLILFYLLCDWISDEFEKRYKLLANVMAVTAVMVIIGLVIGMYQLGGLMAFLEMKSTPNILVSGNTSLLTLRASGDIFLQGGPDQWLLTCFALVVGSLAFGSKSRHLRRWGYYFLLIFIVMGIFAYFRRTTLAGFAVCSALLVWHAFSGGKRRLRRMRYILVLMIVSFIGLYLSGTLNMLINRFSATTLASERSVPARLDLYETALTAFNSSPIFGVGTGSATGDGSIVHNLPLQVAAETGIVGLFLFSLVFVVAFRYLWKLREMFQRRRQGAYSLLTMSVFAVLVGYLVQSLAALDFQTLDPWILLAITSVMWIQFRHETGKKNNYAGSSIETIAYRSLAKP